MKLSNCNPFAWCLGLCLSMVVLLMTLVATPRSIATYVEHADGADDSHEIFSQLQEIMDKQSDAWNRGDLAEFMVPYWHDEGLTFSSGGTTERGWEPTYQRYRKRYPDKATMGTLTFGNLESQRIAPEVVLMLGTWHLQREEPAQGNFTLVWKRMDGQWLIIHDHSSLKAK
jgi:ketosteroid isomerase-like protein